MKITRRQLRRLIKEELVRLVEQQVPQVEPVPVTMGMYCVKEGDTLSAITAQYSPQDVDWQMNHDLNPEISDPDMIHPGQQVEIYLNPDIPADEWLSISVCDPDSDFTGWHYRPDGMVAFTPAHDEVIPSPNLNLPAMRR